MKRSTDAELALIRDFLAATRVIETYEARLRTHPRLGDHSVRTIVLTSPSYNRMVV